MKFYVLKGIDDTTAFRRHVLQSKFEALLPPPPLQSFEQCPVFFFETETALSRPVMERVFTLLGAVEQIDAVIKDGFFITPRRGTLSPWASKASDILHNCGLLDISRIEHGTVVRLYGNNGHPLSTDSHRLVAPLLFDRMTEGIYHNLHGHFDHHEPAMFNSVDILKGGKQELENANGTMGLALSDDEIDYLYAVYCDIKRNPTDVELLMFGQVNSEHCRHKIFKAQWVIDGHAENVSLFDMIRETHTHHPRGTLLAYADNSSVIEGFSDRWFEVDLHNNNRYTWAPHHVDILMKVETHNHPTAISPYPGAATGVGGEIRDEGATGIGGKTKAGLSAFFVSNLCIPGFMMPWENERGSTFPERLATPFEIMIEGPLGGARFGNEFGRPQLLGIFRTFETRHNNRTRGYHKPIMAAGGLGNIKRMHTAKRPLEPLACVIQLGGPALRIGLGGGAASSMDSGQNAENLDFDSVQRDNAEIQRRCQEVINACIALNSDNPILSIHDIGAGGLSNGCPELVAETGGRFWLRKIPNEERAMSPMEIWCCEAQERYVLAIAREKLDLFIALCKRERCPAFVIGETTGDGHLTLIDDHFGNKPIDLDLQVILGKPPRMLRDVTHLRETHPPLNTDDIRLEDAIDRVLHMPSVANKTFLITIADRSITGMVARDQMVGPYQTPISDVAVTTTSIGATTGEAMAMGERTPLALISGPVSGRMAIGEAITNIAAADIGDIGLIKLSANWMCACGEPGEDAQLFDTVKAVARELCPRLNLSIPVGKDSLSMRSLWEDKTGHTHKVVSPLSLLISAFAPVRDIRNTVTPDFKAIDNSVLILLDLGRGRNRLAGSALAQAYQQIGDIPPDLDSPSDVMNFFNAIQELIHERLLYAYHDRSDGGLLATLAEMSFGSRRGLAICIDDLGDDPLSILFNEELGAVIQIAAHDIARVNDILHKHHISSIANLLGSPADDQRLTINFGNAIIYQNTISALNRMWSELTHTMQARRDNPDCAREEYDNLLDDRDPGIQFRLTYVPTLSPAPGLIHRPRMAILREQGINGHVEMAAAFDAAGFESIDVHMTDLLSGKVRLCDFSGLVACGGFSYGDVLGAGSGWAKSILFNEELKKEFEAFFQRKDTFALGVCNGCQMLSQLKSIIPGAEQWPRFTANRSARFEARVVTVEVLDSPSILLKGMNGSRIPIPVAHGEGLAAFAEVSDRDALLHGQLVALRYVDNYGRFTERYPFNPNGSWGGLTGMTTHDGRVTIMMPHPERAFLSQQLSYRPADMSRREGPWGQLFANARSFVS